MTLTLVNDLITSFIVAVDPQQEAGYRESDYMMKLLWNKVNQ